MELKHASWPPSAGLASDYIHHFSQVEELFDYAWQPDALERRLGDLPEQLAADRSALADALRAFNGRFAAPPEALAAIDKLERGDAVAVVGGQQAVLLTGPLLVVHKAVTLLRVARDAERRLGRPVVPVFWIAGEDHDWAEASHTYVQMADGQPRRLELDGAPDGRQPVSRVAVGAEQWERALAELDEALPATEFKPALMDKLRGLCAAADTLVDLFAALMTALFGAEGLVLMDSDDPALRKLEGPMFKQLIDRQPAFAEAFVRGEQRVRALGYTPQAEARADSANLFVVGDSGRLLLHRRADGAYADRGGEAVLTADELAELAEAEPERLSNNVMTRPLMQSYLFPVLATVLGPGEIAYWAMLREAFAEAGMRMPVIVPRMEFTLVENTVRKQMEKLELTFEDALLRLEEQRERWLAGRDELGLPQLFADTRDKFAELYRPLLGQLATVNKGLADLGETNMQKIIEQIHFLETRSVQAFESQFEAAGRQFDRIKASLTPLGKRQERVYNVLAYLNKYGDAWLRELVHGNVEHDGSHIAAYL